jgi:hypothetical protein
MLSYMSKTKTADADSEYLTRAMEGSTAEIFGPKNYSDFMTLEWKEGDDLQECEIPGQVLLDIVAMIMNEALEPEFQPMIHNALKGLAARRG